MIFPFYSILSLSMRQVRSAPSVPRYPKKREQKQGSPPEEKENVHGRSCSSPPILKLTAVALLYSTLGLDATTKLDQSPKEGEEARNRKGLGERI